MDINLIALAIPVFLLLIVVEYLFARHERKEYYRFNDSINDLSCGITQQIVGVFAKTFLFAGYFFLYDRFRLLDIGSDSVLAWVVLFLGVDFLYYWFHRAGHRINAIWAAHVVHHQSEEFNLAVALRQGAFQGWFSWIFYLPLAVIGFPPLMFLTTSAINTLYQFWIHTRLIDKLGPLELVLNTPSHHRVHHGRNREYIDKNYAGVFIIWDRMFGTFEEEKDEVIYGITEPLRSWNPIWANLHYWETLFKKASQFSSFWDKIRLFVMPPEWSPQQQASQPIFQQKTPVQINKYDVRVPFGLNLYIAVQFVPVIVSTFLILQLQNSWPDSIIYPMGAMAVLTVFSLGGLLDRKAWGMKLEIFRLASLAVLLPFGLRHFETGWFAWAIVGSTILLSGFWLFQYRQLLSESSESEAAPELSPSA